MPLIPPTAGNDNGPSDFSRLPPTAGDIESLAQAALLTIPDELSSHIKDLVIRVEDFPDEETEKDMELETPFDLLGLYQGVAMPDKVSPAQNSDVDIIFLYRRPLLDFWCETGEDLSDLVRHVLIHEIGHHFGFDDEDMERIELEE